MSKIYLLFNFLIISTLGFGQAPFSLSFNHLSREEGLSNTNVVYMHKDSRGFLWLGTPNGLNRFNGIECQVFKPTNSGISGENINNIVEDKTGNLWIGTANGLNFYDRKTGNFKHILLPNEVPDIAVYLYCIDNNGLLWFGSRGKIFDGLCIFDPKTLHGKVILKDASVRFASNQNADNQEVRSIIVTSKSDVGLKRLTFENYKIIKTETFFDGTDKLPKLEHIAGYVFQENDSTIWVSQNNLGFIKLNTTTRNFKIFNEFKHKKIRASARFWQYKQYFFVGSSDGIFVFDKQKEVFTQKFSHSPNEPNSLNTNYNEYVYIDKEDNLFVSQLGVGVDFTNLKKSVITHWVNYDFAKNDLKLIDNHVFSMVQ